MLLPGHWMVPVAGIQEVWIVTDGLLDTQQKVVLQMDRGMEAAAAIAVATGFAAQRASWDDYEMAVDGREEGTGQEN
eukprot:10723503-Alexandrium_andersonii.AAC.1